jgi:hypothetical protein
VLAALVACGSSKDGARPAATAGGSAVAVPARADAALASDSYIDLGAALKAIIPGDARVIGFGELHARTDRAQVTSALAHFTKEGLPAIADRLSDLVVETWIPDGRCGSAATQASAQVSVTMRRPQETKSEIGDLAKVARDAKIQPHAMRLTCDDYTRIAPQGKDVQVEEMLALTTRELGRIATEAVVHRDKEPEHRPWIAVYGGALHNDRFPASGVAEWSYAGKVDAATRDHYVEIDLVVPELAEGDQASQREPWYGLVTGADDKVHAYKRGDRSYVLVLPRTPR